MVFVDCRVYERKGETATLVKLFVKEDELLIIVVNKAISDVFNITDTKHINEAFKRIKAVSCNGCPLSDFVIDNPEYNLHAMNSASTPIFDKGIDILLSQIELEPITPTPKKQKICANALLMKQVHLEVNYLKIKEKDAGVEPAINDQILEQIYEFFEKIDLGYSSNDEKATLVKNAGLLMRSLCFVQKHWKVLLRAEYPHIPSGEEDFASSELLKALGGLTRSKKNEYVTYLIYRINLCSSQTHHSILYILLTILFREQISSEKITWHIKNLSNLKWSEFVGGVYKSTIGCLKDEIAIVCKLLQRYKDFLGAKARRQIFSRMNPKSGDKEKTAPAAFKDLLKTVMISGTEFHSAVDSAFKPKKKAGGRPSQFSVLVKTASDNLLKKLRGMPDYEPLFITDEEMCIDKFGEAINEPFLSSQTRAIYREKFRKELSGGVEKMCIHFYGKMYGGGENPDCIFIWKVPAVHGPQHDGKVALAIDTCRKMAPMQMEREAVKHFNTIIDNVANLPAGVRDALRNYLFCGDPDPDESIADEYVQFVLDMAAGQQIDVSALTDGRLNNSRGGKGIGSTQYDEFWKACREVLLPDSAAEERRGSDIIFASAAHSIPNLVKLATDILQRKVDSKELEKLPAIPSTQWVRLQFVPNRTDSKAAGQWTGRLNARRAVQMRTLRKEHMDQHFVNAMTRYYLEWMVELKSKYDGVEFFGQDDKAKIPCGDEIPISTGVRANNRGIVSIGGQGLDAMDHDFHCSNGIAAVTLRCNIPEDVSGSFFIGDEEGGFGQIFVTLRDATFDPSNVFDHCAQLIDCIRKKGLNPTVLVLQTDGGPDHSLKRAATKLALIAVFKELDIDHLVVLRGAPNGSARNKVERSMSVLNLALAHTAIRRGDMPEWAEKDMKGCSSMQAVREVGAKNEKQRLKAVADLPQLEKEYNDFAIAEAIVSAVPKMWEENELPAEQVTAAAAATSDRLLRYLGISAPAGSSDVAGAMVTDTGVDVVRDSSLPSCVAKAKLDKAVKEASQNFPQEYATAMAVPLDAIGERFSNLTTSGNPVIVTPRVPKEGVTTLHNRLKQIAPAYTPKIMLKDHLKKVPEIVSFIESHTIITPYSFSVQKCNDIGCCGNIRTPVNVSDLAMQRQPTPRADIGRVGHFLCRDQALKEAPNQQNALIDLTDMPSNVGDEEKKKLKKQKARDLAVTKELKLKSWEGRRVRAIIVCYNCNKRRCMYSPKEEEFATANLALRQKIESVSGYYSCGDLLFDDDHPLSKVIVQKQSLTCESQIEKGYYANANRSLKVKMICIHCGVLGNDDKEFLYCMPQLLEKNMTEGYDCYPICVDCIASGKKVVKGSKKNVVRAREERIAIATSK